MKSKALTLLLLAALPLAAAGPGLRWGLPGPGRAEKLLPAAWERASLFDSLASGWQKIYDSARGSTTVIAENAGKYSTRLEGPLRPDFSKGPPAELGNSYRSLLIRSMYPDEAQPLSFLAQMNPAKLEFRPPSFLYGGGYVYPLGAWLLVLSKTGAVERLPLREALDKPSALASVYAAGRLLSLLAFAGICVLCFFIAAEFGGRRAGLFALLLAVSAPLGLGHARYLTPHLWAAFWSLLAFYLLLPGRRPAGVKHAALAGLCFGLSAGSYWSQLHAALFLAAALWASGGGPAASFRRAAALAGTAALVFLAFNPYLPGAWRLALAEMFPGNASIGGTYLGNLAGLFTSVLPAVLGPAAALAAAGGCAWAFFSGDRALRGLAFACAAMLLLAPLALPPDFPSWARRFFPWLYLCLVPAALALDRLSRRLPAPAAAAALTACFVPAALAVLLCASDFRRSSETGAAYAKMGAYLDSLPAGGSLGLVEFPQPSNTPLFRLDRWKLTLAAPEIMAALPPKERPPRLLLSHFQKAAAPAGLLAGYELEKGFYPPGPAVFRPPAEVLPVDIPTELYRLREAR